MTPRDRIKCEHIYISPFWLILMVCMMLYMCLQTYRKGTIPLCKVYNKNNRQHVKQVNAACIITLVGLQ